VVGLALRGLLGFGFVCAKPGFGDPKTHKVLLHVCICNIHTQKGAP
jgi:hypothetical protein